MNIFAWLLGIILDFIWVKLSALFIKKTIEKTSRQAVQREAEQSVIPLKKAVTEKEIDDAADEALNHL